MRDTNILAILGAANQVEDSCGRAGMGAGCDRQDIDDQVQDSQTVLALLLQFQNEGQNPQVRAAVMRAMPIVRGHLEGAKRVSATLGSETTQS